MFSPFVVYRSWNQELEKWEQKEKETHHYKQLSKGNDSPRLERALIRTFWKEYICIGLLFSLQFTILVILSPIIVSWIITYFRISDDTKPITKNEVLAYVGYLIMCLVISVFILHHATLLSRKIGMKMRIACCSLIYRKVRISIFLIFINLLILKVCIITL